jgi:hypothetical protein
MTLTSAQATATTAVGEWLLPPSTEVRRQIEEVVRHATPVDQKRARPLRMLNGVARQALSEEIEAKLRMVMSETLVDLILGGWRSYAAVTQAMWRSRNQPGVELIVALRSHTISAERQHDLDIEVDSMRVMTLSTRLAMQIGVNGAVAVVRDGKLIAIRSGQAEADGKVKLEGLQIAHTRRAFPLTAHLAVHSLRPGSSTKHGV